VARVLRGKLKMRMLIVATSLLVAACSRGDGGKASPEELKLGGELFSHFCVGCHPAGGNAIYPQKTLYRMELAANGVRTADDIVARMRHPGRGMRQFDRATLSDREARAIAAYVMATFDR
jgi:cytochrome c6